MEKSHVRYVGGRSGRQAFVRDNVLEIRGNLICRRGTGATFVVRSRVVLRILIRFIRIQRPAESGVGTQSSGQVTEALNTSIDN